jgi:hypothetical protein
MESKTTGRRGSRNTRGLRAFLEAVRWLVFGDRRRFGMLGRCVGFIGQTRSGEPDRLSRVRGKWRLRSTGKLLDDEAVVAKLGSPSFRVSKVIVVPEAAPLLFQGAVEQAEASLTQLMTADRELTDKADDESAVAFQFVMATSAWDKSLRHSIAAIMLALAAAEAQVNEWASARGGWKLLPNGKSEDGLPLLQKMDALAKRHGGRAPVSRLPYSDLRRIVTLRNSLVHSKPLEQEIPLRGRLAPQPGRWLSVEARKACSSVRVCFVALAQLLEEEPPRYLAYAPNGRPDDDQLWANAVVRTGARNDPVFPPLNVGDS